MSSRRSNVVRATFAALALVIVLPASASAQLSRTYVDRATGSDANDCVFETPCQTFQRAHDQTLPNGEINVLGPGNYSAVTITKPITIDGNGNQATITPFGFGVTVNLSGGSGRVVLRDIRINGAANIGAGGIDVLRGGTVITDNVRIFGGSTGGIRVSNNADPYVRLIVDDTKIQSVGAPGVELSPDGPRAAKATIRDSSIDDNVTAGVRLRPVNGGNARVTVRRSDLDVNYNGVVADATGGIAIANVLRSAITESGVDGQGLGSGIISNGASATVRISRNEIQTNQRGLHVLNSGKILSTGDNDIFGNTVNGAPTGTFGRQ